MEKLIITHAQCPDGLLCSLTEDCDTLFLAHNQPIDLPPLKLENREEIIVLDFSLTEDTLRAMLAINPQLAIHVCDHHAGSNEKENRRLVDLGLITYKLTLAATCEWYSNLSPLDWRIIQAIGGRDRGLLWDADTSLEDKNIMKQVYSAFTAYTATFFHRTRHGTLVSGAERESWKEALRKSYSEYLTLGHIQVTQHENRVAKAVTTATVYDNCVVAFNVLPELISDVLNVLSDTHKKVAVNLTFNSTLNIFEGSARSVPGCPITANTLAVKLGGGGHEHASGFKLPIKDQEYKFENAATCVYQTAKNLHISGKETNET